jgi:hypothetical protein
MTTVTSSYMQGKVNSARAVLLGAGIIAIDGSGSSHVESLLGLVAQMIAGKVEVK